MWHLFTGHASFNWHLLVVPVSVSTLAVKEFYKPLGIMDVQRLSNIYGP
jgi:hypothetical protein